MDTKTIDMDQLLSWVRIGTAEQATEAEREIGARFKKVSDSRTKIFMQNVKQGVLLRDLQDFMNDLSYDAGQSDDPDQWKENWEEWKKKYKHYLFEKQQEERAERSRAVSFEFNENSRRAVEDETSTILNAPAAAK